MEEKADLQSQMERLRRAFERRRASRLAESLAQQLSSLPDSTHQVFRLGERLRGMSSREGAILLGEICQMREEGSPLFESLLLHLLAKEQLLEVLGERKATSLRRELHLLGYPDALRYLAQDPPNLQFERRQEGERRAKESLGMRISLARKTAPRLIDRLIFDPDEKVIRTILGNPRLTEAEVLKITSSHRTSPSILTTIAHHQGWICRYKVKLSLVFNPHTPLRISLGLLPLLMRQDLLEIAQYEALPEAVKEKAIQLARMRSSGAALHLQVTGGP